MYELSLIDKIGKFNLFLFVTIGIIIITGVLIDTYEFFKSWMKK